MLIRLGSVETLYHRILCSPKIFYFFEAVFSVVQICDARYDWFQGL